MRKTLKGWTIYETNGALYDLTMEQSTADAFEARGYIITPVRIIAASDMPFPPDRLAELQRLWRVVLANPDTVTDDESQVDDFLDGLAGFLDALAADPDIATRYVAPIALNLRQKVDALCVACSELLDGAEETFMAKNGRRVGIEADDGEKCLIVHSDLTFALQEAAESVKAALAGLPGLATPEPASEDLCPLCLGRELRNECPACLRPANDPAPQPDPMQVEVRLEWRGLDLFSGNMRVGELLPENAWRCAIGADRAWHIQESREQARSALLSAVTAALKGE